MTSEAGPASESELLLPSRKAVGRAVMRRFAVTERLSLAGVAPTDVTPPAGTMLEEYHRTRPSTGVLDRLYATALVLKAGDGAPIALLEIDHIGQLISPVPPNEERER